MFVMGSGKGMRMRLKVEVQVGVEDGNCYFIEGYLACESKECYLQPYALSVEMVDCLASSTIGGGVDVDIVKYGLCCVEQFSIDSLRLCKSRFDENWVEVL